MKHRRDIITESLPQPKNGSTRRKEHHKKSARPTGTIYQYATKNSGKDNTRQHGKTTGGLPKAREKSVDQTSIISFGLGCVSIIIRKKVLQPTKQRKDTRKLHHVPNLQRGQVLASCELILETQS